MKLDKLVKTLSRFHICTSVSVESAQEYFYRYFSHMSHGRIYARYTSECTSLLAMLFTHLLNPAWISCRFCFRELVAVG